MKDLGKTSLGIDANIAGLLSYLGGFITGIIIFVLEKKNRFVRFHALQSIMTFGAIAVFQMAAGFLPFLSFVLPLLNFAGFILWVVLMVKAYQGEMFKLPVAGDAAEKQLNSGFEGNTPEDKNA